MQQFRYTVYRHLPSALRSVAASVWGYNLRRWRYGSETERIVSETLERDQWSLSHWKQYQEELLTQVLDRAAHLVPYYRQQWEERRRRGDRASWEYLENWPILDKRAVRENPHLFVADDCDTRKMYREQTSGTTGTPLALWWSKDTVRNYFALYEARIRRWNNVSWHENWAILGGQPVVPAHVRKPPFWVYNRGLNQLYLSSNHLSKGNIPYYLNALQKYKITHLITYTSSAVYLAQIMDKYKLANKSQLKVIITNAEPLFSWQRDILQHSLCTNIRETYSMAELVLAASEDREGALRLWPEVGYTQIINDTSDTLLPPGNTGRIISTSLLNQDMPLIRYEIGDRGSIRNPIDDPNQFCNLPLLGQIEGRTSDLLITKDGRRIYWVNPIFYGQPIYEAQIIQESLSNVRILFVPASGFTGATSKIIEERLLSRLGDIQVTMEECQRIPRDPSGKFRPVICKVNVTHQE
jgi:phenylacetate-CoA ligase